jgi:hypothetical protein
LNCDFPSFHVIEELMSLMESYKFLQGAWLLADVVVVGGATANTN